MSGRFAAPSEPRWRTRSPGAPAPWETAARVVEWAANRYGDTLVMTTSFGIHAAVLLDLVTRVRPRIPVIWIDTGYLHPETYRHAEALRERLGLDLRVYQPRTSAARMEALYGRLWESDGPEGLDRYLELRKLEPARRALRELGARAWLAGLRAEQTRFRGTLRVLSHQAGRLKICPLLPWREEDLERYRRERELPAHPLAAAGYASVGDVHSSRPLAPGDSHARATRFGGRREECGLHTAGAGAAAGARGEEAPGPGREASPAKGPGAVGPGVAP